jgi:co-chaperonin GroES (HSP10)
MKRHEFDGIKACGSWVIAEQVNARTRTHGGLHVPEQSQLQVWKVVSVGDEVKSCKEGDRILFRQSNEAGAVDGRNFAMIRKDEVIAVLEWSDEDRVAVATGNFAGAKPRLVTS